MKTAFASLAALGVVRRRILSRMDQAAKLRGSAVSVRCLIALSLACTLQLVYAQVFDPVLNPANGHYYQYVSDHRTWSAARTDAASRRFAGFCGHLATITSASENNFVVSAIPLSDAPWLGGFQPSGSPEPDGNWQWVTGESFSYTNWHPGEPNNNAGSPHLGSEEGLHILPNGKWNDAVLNNLIPYIVEYDGATDTTPPVIQLVTAAPNVLGPPNHKMVQVAVDVSASDNCDPAPICRISAVNSNEPVDRLGDGDTSPDLVISENLRVGLRAERAGNGRGRVYTIQVTCSDAAQNGSMKAVAVIVPHDQRR